MRDLNRLLQPEWLVTAATGLIGRLSAGYLRLCRSTTRWDRQGEAELERLLAQGPVIVVVWHDGALMAPMVWPARRWPITTLRDTSPAGRVSGAVQARLGLQPMAMAPRSSNRVASRLILRRLAEGVSVGIAGDGPKGPVRVMKDAALDWARVSGRPVIMLAAAMRRHRRLDTWDRFIMPLPFTRGRVIWRLWRAELPRKADPAQIEAWRADLTAALNQLSDEVWEGLL